MLVDLPETWCGSLPGAQATWIKALRELHADEGIGYPVRLSKGVYQSHLNFDHEIKHLTWDDDNRQGDYGSSVLRLWVNEIWPREGTNDWESLHEEPQLITQPVEVYGVCDHWSQILVKFPQLQYSVIPYLVCVTSIRKEDQGDGGWRWHKWGPYIGAFQEQARSWEYLRDTPDVEEVFVYEVHEMRYPW